MATGDSPCVCGCPQHNHDADDGYCFDCDCVTFRAAPDPASTALRAAAQAAYDYLATENGPGTVCQCEICQLLRKLRAALDEPVAAPVTLAEAVVLTREEHRRLATASFSARTDEESVDYVLAELAAMGFTLRREALT